MHDLIADVTSLVEQDDEFDRNVEIAAINVLDRLQEFVLDFVDESWPPAAGPDAGVAGATVRGGSLHLWYGDELRPDLAFEPIQIQPRSGTPA